MQRVLRLVCTDWRALLVILLSMVLGLALLGPSVVLADEADAKERFKLNLEGAKEAIREIKEELSRFDGKSPPSDKLKAALASLKTHMDALRKNKESHDLSPPDLAEIEKLCKGLGDIIIKAQDELVRLDKEIKETEILLNNVTKAWEQSTVKTFSDRMGAQTGVAVAAASLGLSGPATVGMSAVDYMNFILGKLSSSSNGAIFKKFVEAKLFLRVHNKTIAKRVAAFAKSSGLDLSPKAVQNSKTLQDTIAKRIVIEVTLLAKEEMERYIKKLTALTNKRTLLKLEIKTKLANLAAFRILCNDIKKIETWIKRKTPPKPKPPIPPPPPPIPAPIPEPIPTPIPTPPTPPPPNDPPIPPGPIIAKLNCGSAIEIEAGAEPSVICGIVVRGWKMEGKVTVSVAPIPTSSGIRIFPGNTSQEAFNMHTTGASDFHDRYIFDQFLSAKGTAPEGVTTILITVSQEGHGRVTLPLDISVLPSGRSPSRGGGIRPPVEPATGSTGGLYCVWRSKSFVDGPNCFNINRAQCDDPKYFGKPKYELVGSGMTPMESAALASRLSPYKGDAYGCHRPPPGEQESGGGSESGGGAGTGTGQGAGGGSGSGTGEGEGAGEGEGTGEGEDTGEGTGENQEANGPGEDDDLLAGFPDAPGDAPSADDDPLTPEQAEAVEGFGESGSTSHLPPSDPDQMVSGDSSDTPPVDIAAVAQAERDKDEARNRDREGIQRDEDRQADEDQQAINQQNAQDQQAQDTAAQQGVAQAQAQGQVQIDQANQNADPIMSGQDMAGAIDQIQQEGEDKIDAIDDQIRQGLGGGGQGGGNTPQPLPPPPSMGTGPVDTAVVQCDAKYGAGGDNPGFFTIDFNGATGVAKFEYNTVTQKDEIEVSAGGALFNSTCRSGGESVPITIPSPNTPVTVTVRPNCACKKKPCTGTKWSFTFHCPTGGGGATGTSQGTGTPPRGTTMGRTSSGPGFPSGGPSSGGNATGVGVPPNNSGPSRTPPRTSAPPPQGAVPPGNPSGGLFGF